LTQAFLTQALPTQAFLTQVSLTQAFAPTSFPHSPGVLKTPLCPDAPAPPPVSLASHGPGPFHKHASWQCSAGARAVGVWAGRAACCLGLGCLRCSAEQHMSTHPQAPRQAGMHSTLPAPVPGPTSSKPEPQFLSTARSEPVRTGLGMLRLIFDHAFRVVEHAMSGVVTLISLRICKANATSRYFHVERGLTRPRPANTSIRLRPPKLVASTHAFNLSLFHNYNGTPGSMLPSLWCISAGPGTPGKPAYTPHWLAKTPTGSLAKRPTGSLGQAMRSLLV